MKYSFKTDQVLKCQNEWRSIHFFPEYKIDLNVIELNVGGMCILSCELNTTSSPNNASSPMQFSLSIHNVVTFLVPVFLVSCRPGHSSSHR